MTLFVFKPYLERRLILGKLRGHTVGLCPRCLHIRCLSKHHAFPKRFFGNGSSNQSVLFLCGECHEDIEKIIPYSFRLSKEQYLELHSYFLKGEGFNVLLALVRRYKRKKTNYKNDRAVILLRVTNFKKLNGKRQRKASFVKKGHNGR